MAVVTTQQSVAALYTAIFNRAPDQAGLTYWTAQIDAGASFATVAAGFAQHEVFTSGIGALDNAAYVAALYTNILGSAGDTAGIAYWTDRLAAGESKASVVASFVEGSLTIDLAALLAAGSLSQADYNLALVRQQTLTNKADVGIYFADTLGTASNLNSATVSTSKAGLEADPIYKASQAAIANVDSTAASVQTAKDAVAVAAGSADPAHALLGQTFTLTAGVDTIVGSSGNDTITSTLDANGYSTLTVLDSIDGGAGNDKLVISTPSNLSIPAGVTVKNVETVVLAANGTVSADVSGWTGLTELNVTAGEGGSVTAAATTNVTEANSISNDSISGGNNVTVTHTTAGNVNVNGSVGTVNVNSTAGAVNIGTGAAVTGAVVVAAKGAVAVNGGTDVTVTHTTAGTVAVDGSTGTVNVNSTFGAVNIGIATAVAGAVVVAAKDAVTVNGGTTINASAIGAVSLADLNAHQAASNAASTASNAAINGTDAAGKAASAAQSTVNTLGTLSSGIALATTVAGNNALTLTAYESGTITRDQKIAIDAAFSAKLSTSTDAAHAAAAALITPLSTAAAAANVTAQAAWTADKATAAAAYNTANAVVIADNAATSGTIVAAHNTALTSVTISGNYSASGEGNYVADTSTLQNTLTTATLDHADYTNLQGNALTNVILSNATNSVTVTNTTAGNTQNLTLNTVEEVSVYYNTATTTVNVSSNGSVDNSLYLSANGVTAANITGAANLQLNQDFASTAVIDAHAATGNIETAIGSAQTYLGGSGSDTVYVYGSSVQSKTVDGGAGIDTLYLGNDGIFAGTGAAKFLNFEVLNVGEGVSVDVSKLTGSTITSEILNYNGTITGLNAVQAAHITVANGYNEGSAAFTIGVAGASTVGQLDTVGITFDNGNKVTDVGSYNNYVSSLTLAGVETLNLKAVDGFDITSLTNATALTAVNVSGAGDVQITTGALALNPNTVIDAHAVTGTVYLDASQSTAYGLKLVGSDTAYSTLAGNNTHTNTLIAGNGGSYILGGTAADTITSGNGNNIIYGNGGGDTIIVGNGNNTIDESSSVLSLNFSIPSVVSSTATNTITAGNGWNTIVGGAGADIINVGTGGNTITGGAGADIITFGTHVAGVVDSIVQNAAGQTFSVANKAALVTAAATSLVGADIVTGLHAGDTIDLSAFGISITGASATTLAELTGTTASLVQGNYVANVFTASATGTDTLLAYETNGGLSGSVTEAIVLVGSVVHGTADHGVITLA
jgi:hypothetical protein